MKPHPPRIFWSAFLAVVMCTPGWGASSPQPGTINYVAEPGTINYVEGEVSIDKHSLDENSIGSVRLAAGQSLSTENGRAEILLTPGVFLRVADNSSVEMISPDLENTIVTLQKGRALVEVTDIHRENNIRVNENNASVQLVKTGLYEFDADRDRVRVFDGKAFVQMIDKKLEIKGGHQLNLAAAGKLKAQKFDKREYEDDFYRWASLRSSYLTEANIDAARRYATGSGWSPNVWYGAGWYWDPWFSAYTFIPGDGIFYSPFGWGFYSPWYVARAPYFGYFGRYRHFGPAYHLPSIFARGRGFAGPAFHSRSSAPGGFGRGVRSGSTFGRGGLRGGGFHGGGRR